MGKRHIVALDRGLSSYRRLLTEEGFEVADLDGDPAGAEAILLSGLDENELGIQTRASEAFVMDVRGRQPEEVLYDLQKHFRLKEG